MANSKKYLNILKNSEFGIYLPYVESVVFEVEGLASRSQAEIIKLKLKRVSQVILLLCVVFSMVIMPSFLITLTNQTPNVTAFEVAAYYFWMGFGFLASFIYFRALKGKRKDINAEINNLKHAVYVAVSYAQSTIEAYFDDKVEHFKPTNIQLDQDQIQHIDSAMSRCEIDLTMFDRHAYNNDNYRNMRASDKRRDPQAKKLSLHFLMDYLKYNQNLYKPTHLQ